MNNNPPPMKAWMVSLIFRSGRNIMRLGLGIDPIGVAAQMVLDGVRDGLLTADDVVTSVAAGEVPAEMIATAHRVVVEGQAPSAPVLTLHQGDKPAPPPNPDFPDTKL